MLMTIESFTYDFAGDTFIDVGGNVGMWTTKIAPHYTNVLFIEASDIAMNLAKKNIEEAGVTDKVTYFKNLCSDSVGEQKTITASGEDSGNFSIYNKELYGEENVSMTESDIETITLDSLIPLIKPGSKVLIKIDTEGCELDILLGAKKLIAEFKPVIMMEAHYHMYYDEEKEGAIIDMLNECNYSCLELKMPNYLHNADRIYDGIHNGKEMYDLHYHMLFESQEK